jgi:hypothetical protein
MKPRLLLKRVRPCRVAVQLAVLEMLRPPASCACKTAKNIETEVSVHKLWHLLSTYGNRAVQRRQVGLGCPSLVQAGDVGPQHLQSVEESREEGVSEG